jgi:hypothetical protein
LFVINMTKVEITEVIVSCVSLKKTFHIFLFSKSCSSTTLRIHN